MVDGTHHSIGLLVVTILVAVCAKEIKLPDTFVGEHVCSRNDPEMERCLLKGIEDIRPYLKGGIPQYNVPSLDPFHIPEMNFAFGEIQAKAKNIVVHGGSNYKFTNLKVSDDRLNIKAEIQVPELHYEYDYDVDVSFALIPIKGFGTVRGNLTDIRVDVKLIGTLEDQEDGKHINFKKSDVNVDVGERFVRFNNLYKGATLLTESTNEIINANSRQISMLTKPLTNHIISMELPKIFKKITDTFLFDDLFPDN